MSLFSLILPCLCLPGLHLHPQIYTVPLTSLDPPHCYELPWQFPASYSQATPCREWEDSQRSFFFPKAPVTVCLCLLVSDWVTPSSAVVWAGRCWLASTNQSPNLELNMKKGKIPQRKIGTCILSLTEGWFLHFCFGFHLPPSSPACHPLTLQCPTIAEPSNCQKHPWFSPQPVYLSSLLPAL